MSQTKEMKETKERTEVLTVEEVTTRKEKQKDKGKNPGKKKAKNRHNKDLGAKGEEAAVQFLKRRGYEILERNWTCFAGEADIIATDDDAIHFVEVKTRIGEGKGFPVEAVDAKKRQRYEQIAELYLNDYEGSEASIVFDVISINVLANGRAMVRVYNNILACDCDLE